MVGASERDAYGFCVCIFRVVTLPSDFGEYSRAMDTPTQHEQITDHCFPLASAPANLLAPNTLASAPAMHACAHALVVPRPTACPTRRRRGLALTQRTTTVPARRQISVRFLTRYRTHNEEIRIPAKYGCPQRRCVRGTGHRLWRTASANDPSPSPGSSCVHAQALRRQNCRLRAAWHDGSSWRSRG